MIETETRKLFTQNVPHLACFSQSLTEISCVITISASQLPTISMAAPHSMFTSRRASSSGFNGAVSGVFPLSSSPRAGERLQRRCCHLSGWTVAPHCSMCFDNDVLRRAATLPV